MERLKCLSIIYSYFVMTDEQLKICIGKFQSGEIESFADIYEEFFEKIYRYVYFRVQHKETAEDLVSNIFFKVSQNLKRFDSSKARFSTWIYTVARNTIIDHWKTEKRFDDLNRAENLAVTKSTDIDSVMQLEKIQAFLDTLPQNSKDIIIMRVWDGLSHAEIAAVMNQSEDSIKMTYSRSLKKIRERFGGSATAMVLAILITLK